MECQARESVDALAAHALEELKRLRRALHPLDGLTKLLFNTKLGGNNYITYHPNARPDDNNAPDLDPELHLLRALFTSKSKADAMPVRFEAIKGSPWPLTFASPLV